MYGFNNLLSDIAHFGCSLVVGFALSTMKHFSWIVAINFSLVFIVSSLRASHAPNVNYSNAAELMTFYIVRERHTLSLVKRHFLRRGIEVLTPNKPRPNSNSVAGSGIALIV
jgi:hypothetical protein